MYCYDKFANKTQRPQTMDKGMMKKKVNKSIAVLFYYLYVALLHTTITFWPAYIYIIIPSKVILSYMCFKCSFIFLSLVYGHILCVFLLPENEGYL